MRPPKSRLPAKHTDSLTLAAPDAADVAAMKVLEQTTATVRESSIPKSLFPIQDEPEEGVDF